MPRVERDRELARRRSRKVKLKKLRERYAKADSKSERQEIIAKARKISPFVDLEAEKKSQESAEAAAEKSQTDSA